MHLVKTGNNLVIELIAIDTRVNQRIVFKLYLITFGVFVFVFEFLDLKWESDCVFIFQILFFNCKVVIKYALSNYKDLGGAYIHHREGQIIIKKEKIIKLIIKFSKDQNSYNGI